MKRPIIGITSSIRKDQIRKFLHVGYGYINNVERAGGIPIVLPVLKNLTSEAINNITDFIDGIIFTGGENVDSLWYGEEPLEKQSLEAKLRNNFEKALFFAAKSKRLPILGICRGNQLINVLQGGSLFQSIDKQLGTKIDHKGVGKKLSDKQHSVFLEKNSLIYKIYGKSCIGVNSFHSQCIKDLGRNLKITGKSEDGIPEAIEHVGEIFMLGVQWHPELLDDHCKLFKEFIDICSNNNNVPC